MSVDPVSLGIQVALTAAQIGLAASQRIEGPRVKDLNVAVSEYGGPILQFHGTRRSDACPYIFAEPLHEVQRQAKTKGGKYNEYTYFATWASLFVGHEIDAITRIWFDRHLAFQATDAGPLTIFPLTYTTTTSKGKGSRTTTVAIADHMRIYLGSSSQMPDPRMLSTIEAEHGAGSCPAYRGRAFVMFEEIPVEKFGNRIPQVTIEGTRNAAPAFPYETFACDVAGPVNLLGFSYSPDYSVASWGINGEFEVWDVATRTPLLTGPLPLDAEGDVFSRAGSLSSGGRRWLVSRYASALTGHMQTRLQSVAIDGTGELETHADTAEIDEGTSWWGDEAVVLSAADGREYVIVLPNPTYTWALLYKIDGAATAEAIDVSWQPTGAFTDVYGDIWICGGATGGGATECHFLRVVAFGESPIESSSVTATGLASSVATADAFACHYADEAVDHFVLAWDRSQLYTVDTATGSVTTTRTYSTNVSATDKRFRFLPPGASSIWLDEDEIALVDLTTIRSLDAGDWDGGTSLSFGQSLYDPANHAILGAGGDDVEWSFLDRVSGGPVTLRVITEDVASQCGVDPARMDATAMTQVVRGFSFVQASGKDILDPPLSIHDAFARPHGFTLEFLNRGAASGGTLAEELVAAPGDGSSEDAPPWQSRRNDGGDLPRAVAVSFADVDADQQRNLARSPRPIETVKSAREMSIDLSTLAMTAAEARDLADRHLRRRWMGRVHHGLAYSMRQIALEPGDVRTVILGGTSHLAWAASMRIEADRRVTLDWERDDPSVNLLGGQDGGEMEGHLPGEIVISPLARVAILDIPLIRDADESRVPFLYFTAGTYGASFRGAEIWQSDTLALDDYVAGWGSVATGSGMTWGAATDTLPAALPWVFDRGSTLNVRFRGGTPGGATEAELLANANRNLLAVGSHSAGWELLQFAHAELEGDGSWTLSTFLRGVRGTEHRIAEHGAGAIVVLLSGLGQRTMGASEIGDADAYRAVAAGRTLQSAFEERVTFSAEAQKPYAPVHGALSLDGGTGDWSITATRRSRIGGASVNGQDVPLGETAESWAAEILDGADVVRTVTGSSLPLAYTAAQQTTDFGAPQTSLAVRLYQVAPDLNLRGHPLALAA